MKELSMTLSMKPFNMLLLIGLLATATPAAHAEEKAPETAEETEVSDPAQTTEIGMLPGLKRGSAVEVSERNPYARRVVEVAQGDDRETEALQLRRILESLTVRGRTRGPSGQRVLLGALRLEEGKELPPLIQNQSDRLIVTAITEAEVEISWLSESGTQLNDSRTLRIPIKVDHDSVRMRLNTGAEQADARDTWIRVPFGHLRSLDIPMNLEQAEVTDP